MAETIGATAFMECSAQKQQGVAEIFHAATKAALHYRSLRRKRGSSFFRKAKLKEESLERIKVVVMGNSACGKTNLLSIFSQGTCPAEYVPTVFETHITDLAYEGKQVELALWDTGGREEYNALRPTLVYGPNATGRNPKSDADVILICYSIVEPSTFERVASKWAAEARRYCPDVPVILVGCKSDSRTDADSAATLTAAGEAAITLRAAQTVADAIGAFEVLECSAKENRGVSKIFQTAIKAALHFRGFKRKRSGRGSFFKAITSKLGSTIKGGGSADVKGSLESRNAAAKAKGDAHAEKQRIKRAQSDEKFERARLKSEATAAMQAESARLKRIAIMEREERAVWKALYDAASPQKKVEMKREAERKKTMMQTTATTTPFDIMDDHGPDGTQLQKVHAQHYQDHPASGHGAHGEPVYATIPAFNGGYETIPGASASRSGETAGGAAKIVLHTVVESGYTTIPVAEIESRSRSRSVDTALDLQLSSQRRLAFADHGYENVLRYVPSKGGGGQGGGDDQDNYAFLNSPAPQLQRRLSASRSPGTLNIHASEHTPAVPRAPPSEPVPQLTPGPDLDAPAANRKGKRGKRRHTSVDLRDVRVASVSVLHSQQGIAPATSSEASADANCNGPKHPPLADPNNVPTAVDSSAVDTLSRSLSSRLYAPRSAFSSSITAFERTASVPVPVAMLPATTAALQSSKRRGSKGQRSQPNSFCDTHDAITTLLAPSSERRGSINPAGFPKSKANRRLRSQSAVSTADVRAAKERVKQASLERTALSTYMADVLGLSETDAAAYQAMWKASGSRAGTLGGAKVFKMFAAAGVSAANGKVIWARADKTPPHGRLTENEFYMALKLIALEQQMERSRDLPDDCALAVAWTPLPQLGGREQDPSGSASKGTPPQQQQGTDSALLDDGGGSADGGAGGEGDVRSGDASDAGADAAAAVAPVGDGKAKKSRSRSLEDARKALAKALL